MDVSEGGTLPTSHRRALIDAANFLVDQCFDDLCDVTVEGWDFLQCYIAIYLPRQHLAAYTPLFARQFLVCLLTVAWKLAHPSPPALSCVAEELALRAIISEAGRFLQEKGITPGFSALEDEILEDTDLETLFDASLYGIDDSEIGAYLGIGPLRPRDWFKSFAGAAWQPVHPYVVTDQQNDYEET